MSDDDMNFSPIARHQWNTRTGMLSELSVTCHHVHKKRELSRFVTRRKEDCPLTAVNIWLCYKIKMIMNQASAIKMARGVKGYIVCA